MKWKGRKTSSNFEDRRGMRAGPIAAGGGVGALVIALVVMFMGGDPSVVLEGGGGGGAVAPPVQGSTELPEDELGTRVLVVLQDTEDTWNQIFRDEFNQDYPEPELVMFTGATQSGCGFAQSAMGPFYCPLDNKVYIDLSFYDDLRRRFGASGDFAQAYVIAHEVGHHVQTVLGISQQIRSEQQRLSQADANELSVRLELQADCLAGLWAANTQQRTQFLEAGDVEEALTAAAAIGDDRIQQQTQGRVAPESFTHGTSEQRARWFNRGFQAADVDACDTFVPGPV